MKERLKKYYPPGYDYIKEWISVISWFVVGLIFSMILFFTELVATNRKLFITSDGLKLIEGAIVRPFMKLMEGQLTCFIPMFIFLLVMMVYHYIYYYQGTKSIYVMRRLSSKKYIFKSCIEGTIVGAVTGLAAMCVLFALYYLIYYLAIPSECMPRFM